MILDNIAMGFGVFLIVLGFLIVQLAISAITFLCISYVFGIDDYKIDFKWQILIGIVVGDAAIFVVLYVLNLIGSIINNL